MDKEIQTLRRKRLSVFLMSIAYFAVLLAVGTLIFIKGTAYGLVLVLACAAVYLAAVRPYISRYKNILRAAILRCSLSRDLTDYSHDPKAGAQRTAVENAGLVNTKLSAFRSRELICGRCGTILAEAADVTFPIRENDLNTMFNGCFIALDCPGARFEPAMVLAGQLSELSLPPKQTELLEKIGSLIPGSLYFHMEGERMTFLLRGRFLGFRINPLVPVTEKLLCSDPLPELHLAIQLARVCSGKLAQD